MREDQEIEKERGIGEPDPEQTVLRISGETDTYSLTLCAFRHDSSVDAEKFVQCVDSLVRSAYGDGEANERKRRLGANK